MGNVAVTEELAGSDELEELYRLDASETEPEAEPEDDEDEDDEDERAGPGDGDEEFKPEGHAASVGRGLRRDRLGADADSSHPHLPVFSATLRSRIARSD